MRYERAVVGMGWDHEGMIWSSHGLELTTTGCSEQKIKILIFVETYAQSFKTGGRVSFHGRTFWCTVHVPTWPCDHTSNNCSIQCSTFNVQYLTYSRGYTTHLLCWLNQLRWSHCRLNTLVMVFISISYGWTLRSNSSPFPSSETSLIYSRAGTLTLSNSECKNAVHLFVCVWRVCSDSCECFSAVTVTAVTDAAQGWWCQPRRVYSEQWISSK